MSENTNFDQSEKEALLKEIEMLKKQNSGMQNFYTGLNYSCIYCGSLFNEESCPNCGATEYKLSPGRLAWEETQRRAMQEAQAERLHEQKQWESKEKINRTNRRTHLAVVISFLAVFLLIWIMQLVSMSSMMSGFSRFSSFF